MGFRCPYQTPTTSFFIGLNYRFTGMKRELLKYQNSFTISYLGTLNSAYFYQHIPYELTVTSIIKIFHTRIIFIIITSIFYFFLLSNKTDQSYYTKSDFMLLYCSIMLCVCLSVILTNIFENYSLIFLHLKNSDFIFDCRFCISNY